MPPVTKRHVAGSIPGALITTIVISTLALTACNQPATESKPSIQEAKTMALQIQSPAFGAGQEIPTKYTCDGEDLSPPLQWSGIPAGTKSLALICDDPDAPVGTWVHWVVCGIGPTVVDLASGIPTTPMIASGALQGTNDFRRAGYGGPCPPPGKPHRYFFKLYALDTQPNLPAGTTKRDLEAAMQGHVLAQGELMGTYQRKRS